jgi:tripeptide aminopeptidase
MQFFCKFIMHTPETKPITITSGMNMQIDQERLAATFITLCEIDSPSKQEGKVAEYIKAIFTEMNTEIFEDDSALETGSDCGNLIVRCSGNLEKEPIFLNCHMDTVLPAEGVKVLRQGEVFTSQGNTVLGGDDKAGIAVLVEVMRTLTEKNIPYGPVELVFTTCEEVGLLGVKAFDPTLLQSKIGYALDTTGVHKVITGAPAANRIVAEINGAAAHAGLNPEEGINAIQLAAQAIAGLQLGRLDSESTANIGLVKGGTATNIIPEKAVVKGEVRSHSEDKLADYTEKTKEAFSKVISTWLDPAGKAKGKPTLTFQVIPDYPVMKLDKTSEVLRHVEQAATAINADLEFLVAGGGSDANIFNSYGLQCAILSTGMDKVHSTEETIRLQDMVSTAELVMALLV